MKFILLPFIQKQKKSLLYIGMMNEKLLLDLKKSFLNCRTVRNLKGLKKYKKDKKNPVMGFFIVCVPSKLFFNRFTHRSNSNIYMMIILIRTTGSILGRPCSVEYISWTSGYMNENSIAATTFRT
jgi:hypothetical protein